MRLSAWRCAAALPRAASLARVTRPSTTPFTRISSSASSQSAPLASIGRFFSSTPRRYEAELPQLTKFAELGQEGLVHENIVRSITGEMGLETMTDVQSATVRSALLGSDVIAQAKTGTGKTIAFLLPMLQRMIQEDPNLARSTYRPPRTSPDDIRGIVISPTRELAEQIAEEARKVVKGTSIVVQTAVGGTQKREALRQMQRQGCHLLVGTPGRLDDLFGDQYSGVAAPRLKALVLDEADRLLDAGFWPDIQRLISLLPAREKTDRQTLMFSATIPREVVGIVRQTLKPGFQFVRIIGENDTPTTERVKQKLVIARGYENQLPILFELAQTAIQKAKSDPTTRPFKAIVYFRSTNEVTFSANLFRRLSTSISTERDAFGMRAPSGPHPLSPCKVFDIHARLTQPQRTAAADQFKRAECAILFSSDVTARGMDFPNVTHVIQIGRPQDRESYIHRIGRTARAGKEGEGWIVVTEDAVDDVDRLLRKIPIDEDTTLATAQADILEDAQDPTTPAAMIQRAAKTIRMSEKADVYSTLLFAQASGGSKRAKVEAVNTLAKSWGMEEPPMVKSGMAQKLGFSREPGLRIGEPDYDDAPRSAGGRSGGGRFGSSGGGRFGGGGGGGDRYGGSRFGGGGGRDRDGGDPFGDRSGGGSRFGDRSGGGSRFGGDRGGSNRGGRSGGGSRFGDNPMSVFD